MRKCDALVVVTDPDLVSVRFVRDSTLWPTLGRSYFRYFDDFVCTSKWRINDDNDTSR